MRFLQKILPLLSIKQKWSMCAIFCLMLVGMVLETFGVGLVIPLIAFLNSPESINQTPIAQKIISFLGHPDQNQLAIYVMGGLVFVFAFKSVFLGFLSWRQMAFIYDVQADISQRLFAGYLAQDYAFHLDKNSAQLIRNTVQEVQILTNTTMMASMILLTEALVAIGIGVLLLAVEPVGALLVIAVLGISTYMFLRLTKPYLIRWGRLRQESEGKRIQYLQQGLGGIKDVKLAGREGAFLKEFALPNNRVAMTGRRMGFLQALPRLWLEFLAVFGLAILVFSMLSLGRPIADIVPVLGLFAAAAFRLLPSANRLVGAIQNVRFSLPVIDLIHAELTQIAKHPAANAEQGAIAFQRDITVNGVSFNYASGSERTLSNISFTIQKGSIFGFVGPSGAGKSTLLDILLGLLTPIQGTVTVDGVNIAGYIRNWQAQIGYVPQSIFLTDDSLRRNIAFGIENARIDDEAVWRALEAAQLAEFVRELPEGLETEVGERGVRLSGGQRQRIGIARALYHDPDLLVLDEATSALDMATEAEVMKAVTALRGKKTILIVAHRLSTVASCDQIVLLNAGKIEKTGAAETLLSSLSTTKSSQQRELLDPVENGKYVK